MVTMSNVIHSSLILKHAPARLDALRKALYVTPVRFDSRFDNPTSAGNSHRMAGNDPYQQSASLARTLVTSLLCMDPSHPVEMFGFIAGSFCLILAQPP
jgi:hypothetical protein